ncbi:Non-ribosomal peptide synthetase modules (plasmid) [Streptantibioticus cattleyicolor NRRL 8057 = DSM 46488]|nr:Non-ribosomal peptide synthetase modules [Streptantibioticus cattleyicolor NRRL 8057 = DSM 46488]
MHHVFERTCDRTPSATALECGEERFSYARLDARANRLAHFLRGLGLGEQPRVAVLLPRSPDLYAALLAVGKAGAVLVPVDPASPPDRVAHLVADCGAGTVLTTSALAPPPGTLPAPVTALDAHADEIAAQPATRPPPPPSGDDDPLAYVMYTSGSSGRPKGVAIAQSSIVNFLDVVPGVYGVRPDDRVHQGMTVSFDFSVEEIWPTWAVGATLVAGEDGAARFGAELADSLTARRITVLYCVPTLLATIPRELPAVRTLVVGGEACPPRLVERWSRPGRRILNTYGPTEATVTATCAELRPGRPVTIGRPLPTCTVVLLDERRRPVADGAVGEICVGGPGVARGYLGRPDLTADRFIRHPAAPGDGRLYRTGDLGRTTPDGEIEYLGRADDEVKIRGYRVDLGEIDGVLREDHEVADAVTTVRQPPDGDGGDRLSAYVRRAPGATAADEALAARLRARLRDRLPPYMVPASIDVLDAFPTMPSGKVDRRALPEPTRRGPFGTGPVAAAEGPLETRIRDVWAQMLGVPGESLPADADFFTDLGGHSLLAARAVSALREAGVGGGPALRDLYAHPTVRALAGHLEGRAGVPVRHREARQRPGSGRVAAAGAVQAGVVWLLLALLTCPVAWAYGRSGGTLAAGEAVGVTGAVFAGYLGVRWLVPPLLVRALTAGVGAGRYPLWGAVYLRLWTADRLLGVAPLPVLSGSPMMAGYLRLLGARIGPGTQIASGAVTLPAMLRIGAGASVGYGAVLRPWRVADGQVVVAPIEIGAGAYVGAGSVLEPGARVGPGGGLAEQSVLGPGESVPAGARRAGSPPVPVDALAPAVESMLREPAPPGWRPGPAAAALTALVLLEAAALLTIVPSLALFWWAALTLGAGRALVAAVPAGPLFVLTVCGVVASGRRLVLPRSPVGVHPVRSYLGVRKWVCDKLLEMSLAYTNPLYATLYTVPWLRLLGARVGRWAEVSTASHLDPDLLTLRDGSFVADMASVGCAAFAGGRMAFGPTEVGRRAFVGNAAYLPAGTRTGPGSLIGVGTVPPPDGVAAGTSWLGSPAIRLPVRQGSGAFPEELTFRPSRWAVLQRLAVEWCRVTLPATLLAAAVYGTLLAVGATARAAGTRVAVVAAPVAAMAAGTLVIACCALLKWLVVGGYRARVEPLWSWFVRRTEFVTGLYEAAAVPAGLGLLTGTPFLPVALRGFGARIGRRVWLGTTYLTEFDLVRVGDDAAVGFAVSLQTHLFEDRVMKMSQVTVGPGASVGARSVVLYDSVVGAGVRLGALSLVMKGEHLTRDTDWRGIPAETQDTAEPDRTVARGA